MKTSNTVRKGEGGSRGYKGRSKCVELFKWMRRKGGRVGGVTEWGDGRGRGGIMKKGENEGEKL